MDTDLGVIPGLKLIKLNSNQVDEPDDPSMPYKLEALFRPPEFMQVTFVMLFGGTEELVVRGETLEAIQELVEKERYRTHPRLRKLTITGPDDTVVEEVTR